jgi:predicted nucleic acid-binding protein
LIQSSVHVKAVEYTDQEIEFVDERDRVTAYRDWLRHSLKNVRVLPHEEIISKLDRAGQTFRVFVMKSNMTIPYTSVSIELDCAYWNADAERHLRSVLKKRKLDIAYWNETAVCK